MIFDEAQQAIANKIENNRDISKWRDWKWQLKHSVKSLDQFEKLTGIRFESKERDELLKTFDKFPLSVTPYYLSLLDKSDTISLVPENNERLQRRDNNDG
ncbi:MAG: hypothetical protein WD577_03085 [Bacteroidales bacterium]